MLTQATAVDYLLQHNLLTEADIVLNGVLVYDVSRRNHNFAVRVNNRPGYFLKQSDIRQSRKTLHEEAELYHSLWTNAPEFASSYMAPLHWFDSAEEILILDYLEPAQPLNRVQSSLDSNVPIACAIELGRALSRLHSSELPTRRTLQAPAPWILSVYSPGQELFDELSSAAISVATIVQQIPDFGSLFSSLRESHELGTTIHGDIRWDNCLIRLHSGSEEDLGLFIVDWELAGFGDPAWDVAGVFSEYLNSWISSLPVTSSLSLSDSLSLAACPLDAMQLRLATFWDSYSREGGDFGPGQAFLLRAIQLSGARLVQSAIESAQMSSRVTRTIVYMLQLARNIMDNPRRAAAEFLQLPTR